MVDDRRIDDRRFDDRRTDERRPYPDDREQLENRRPDGRESNPERDRYCLFKIVLFGNKVWNKYSLSSTVA